ncbi:integral membrane protein [Coniochaeta sp. 2T2.1]|nr:integral membrane protein [Coniochaeta sp. 2T2.1]
MADQVTLPPEIASQNKGPGILAAIITVSVVSTLFVLGRLFVRIKIIEKLYLDDYFIMLSTICGWLAVGFSCAAVNSGNGKHFSVLSLDEKSGAILWTMVGFLPGVMSFGLPKFAVVALLTRILNASRTHTIFLWTMTTLCMASLVGCIVILFAQCTPSRSQWDSSVKGHCWDRWILVHYSMYAGAFSAVADLYLAVYPAVVLAKLQLNLKKKLALSIALGIGSIATVVAIYKTTRLPALASPDFSYDTSDLVTWTVVEGSTVTVASCIPIMQPLVEIIFGKRALNGSSAQKYHKYGPDRSGNLKSEHELESSRGMHRNRGDAHYEDGLRTLDTKDSQETILRQGQDREETTRVATKNSKKPYGGGIVRTDVFAVSYETDSELRRSP